MRWRSVLVVPFALSVTLAACGGDDDGAEAPTAVTVAPPPPTRAATTVPAPTTTVVAPTTSVSTTVPAVVPAGFAARRGVITAVDGTACDVCLWLAETPGDRARGLMGVTDLGGADGMVFVWDAPTQGSFWMRDTPTPLSIAFFAADGSFISSADMAPCLDGPDQACARYAAAGPYQLAIEVQAGGLEAILAVPGSVLQLLDAPCEPGAASST